VTDTNLETLEMILILILEMRMENYDRLNYAIFLSPVDKKLKGNKIIILLKR